MRATSNTVMKVACDQIISKTIIRRSVTVTTDTISAMNRSNTITRRANLSSISGTYSGPTVYGTESSLPLHAQCFRNDDDNETKGNVAESRTIVRQLSYPSPANLQHSLRQVNGFHSSSLSSFSQHKSRMNTTQSYQICQSRAFGLSSRTERAPQTAILALGTVALTAKAGQYAVQAYNEWAKNQPDPPPPSPENKSNETEGASENQDTTKSSENTEGKKKANATNGTRENFFQKYFNIGVGSKYYEGGFEDKMTKREAALILGVRESSTPKRIKEAHRKLLILNHPDTGGSTYLAGKLNEAKDILLKGRREK